MDGVCRILCTLLFESHLDRIPKIIAFLQKIRFFSEASRLSVIDHSEHVTNEDEAMVQYLAFT